MRVLRVFIRSTWVTENVIKVRLGKDAGHFLGDMVPELMDANVLRETPSLAGHGRRFKLGAQMVKVEEALKKSAGRYKDFLVLIRAAAPSDV